MNRKLIGACAVFIAFSGSDFSCADIMNHAPAFLQLRDQHGKTGTELRFNIQGYDEDGDALTFSMSDAPAKAQLINLPDKRSATFVWTPLSTDAGNEGTGVEFHPTFTVSDGKEQASEKLSISITLGGAGTGAPRFITPSEQTLDLDRSESLEFVVQVRDEDSAAVDLTVEQPIEGATFQTTPGSKEGRFIWRPTPEQASRPMYMTRISANDHANAPTVQNLLVIVKGGKKNCKTTTPQVVHNELTDQKGSGDYAVAAEATDTESAITAVKLFYMVAKDTQSGELQEVAMTPNGGSSFVGAIPNPGLSGDQKATVSYKICATDNDDPNSEACDLTKCLPEEGQYTFTAYAPGSTECQDDGFAGNAGPAQAADIQEGTFEKLKLCAGTQDWFRLSLPAQTQVDIELSFTSANGELSLDILQADGATVLASAAAEADRRAISYSAQGQGMVLVRIGGLANVDINYDMKVLFNNNQSCAQDTLEIGDSGSKNDTAPNAKTITAGSYPGLTSCNDQDWYAVQLMQGQRLEVTAQHQAGDMELYIADQAIAYSSEYWGCEEAIACSATDQPVETAVVNSVAATGKYYILLWPYSEEPATYNMTVAISEGPVCTADAGEPNDSPVYAEEIFSGTPVNRTICPSDEDWYKFAALSGETLTVELSFVNADGDLDAYLYDAAVTPDQYENGYIESASTPNDMEHISYPVTVGDVFYIRVNGYKGASNSYWLTVSSSANSW